MSKLIDVAKDGKLTVKNVKIKNATNETSYKVSQYVIYVNAGATLDIEGDETEIGPFAGNADCVEVVGNKAVLNLKGGKLLGNGDNNTSGNCVYVKYGTVNMSGGSITGNDSRYGNGIQVYEAEVNLTGGEISNNKSSTGAGLALTSSVLKMSGGSKIINNTVFEDADNYCWGEGAAIYMFESTAEITGGEISGNKAEGSGGAIMALDSSLTIGGNTVISKNEAVYSGGAIFIEANANSKENAFLTVTSGEISGNTAGSSGAGIFADCYQRNPGSVKVIISGGKITGNHTGTEENENVEENAVALMGYAATEEPDENTGYADLYLSGTSEIKGSVAINDDVDFGPRITVTDEFKPTEPVLLSPIYGTPGRTAVSYSSSEAANANKTQFKTEYASTRGLKQNGEKLIWTTRYRVPFRTFSSFDPIKYSWDKCVLYVEEGDSVATEDLPQAEAIPGYTRIGWRDTKTGKAWDPATKITSNMQISEVWALNKPTVTIEQSQKQGCPSSAIVLTAKATHDLDTTTFTYQWYKDGEALDGQTDASYTAKDGGEYKVIVTAIGAGSNAKSITETSVTLPAFAHDYSWKSDSKNHWQTCSICNESTKAEAHSFGDWTVTKEAAVSVEGEKTRTCKVCGYKETEKVAALPAPTATPTPTVKPQTVKTTPFIKLTSKKSYINIRWNKVKGADGYRIYGTDCGGGSYKFLKDVNGNTIKWTHKGLKAGTYYKYYVVAYKNVNGKKVTIEKTVSMHIATAGKNFAYAKALNVNKKKVTLNKGKSLTLKAKVSYSTGKIRNHVAAVRYRSSDATVASVNSKGVITAKKKGTCTIYCYTQNGIRRDVKVTVK